ncbi:MAG: hypothetical protein DME86_12770 [Verrucomicrobia bacterium]|nr:MAG: hypothetical protein DME86_12770 [Verrucomicrobiota bacterium]
MSDRTTTLNHESANRTATASAEPAATSATIDDKEHQKLVRKLVALLIILAAVVLTLYVWSVLERHPRTDDAAARANVVGIVPRARGQIAKLAVQDNQLVKQGDLLFEIDPADYEHALERTVEIRNQGRRGWRSKRERAAQAIGGYVAPARAAAAKAFRNGGTSRRGANEGCGSRTGSGCRRAKT